MRIIHSNGFSLAERKENRAVIYSNMVVAFNVLLDIMATEEIEFGEEKTKVCARFTQCDLRLTCFRLMPI